MTGPGKWSWRAFFLLTCGAFVLVSLAPVALVLVQSVWVEGRLTFVAYTRVLAESRQWALLRNSLAVAAGASALACMLGVPAGYVIEYVRARGRGVMMALTAATFLIPPYIGTVAWIDLLGGNGYLAHALKWLFGAGAPVPGIYNVYGAILILGVSYLAIPALTTSVAVRRLDRRVEEPARLMVKGGRVFRPVVLPLTLPGVFTGALFVFMLALLTLGPPSLLQVDTYPVEVYAASAIHDVPGAIAHAAPIVVAGGLGMFLFLRWLPALGEAQRQDQADRQPLRGSAAAAVTVWVWAVLLMTCILPLAALFVRSLPLVTFWEVWLTARREFFSSLAVAFGSASLLTLLGLAMAVCGHYTRRAGAFFGGSVVAFLVSGPLVGLGLIALWNRPGPLGWVYDHLPILVIACAARYLFFAHRGAAGALDGVDRRMEEAARMAGLTWWRQVLFVLLPPVAPALVGLWGLAFVWSLRELDAAVLVTPPGVTPVSVRLFTLMHYGPDRFVAALSLVMVAMLLAGAAAVYTAHDRMKRGVHGAP